LRQAGGDRSIGAVVFTGVGCSRQTTYLEFVKLARSPGNFRLLRSLGSATCETPLVAAIGTHCRRHWRDDDAAL
jgi:hypothetical protein